jgi:hypothetical protein
MVEASTAVKADLFKYLFRTFVNEDKFVYLDPDVCIYSRLDDLDIYLDTHSIVLTPHQLKDCGHVFMEASSLEHGVYNLGFLALKRSEEANRIVEWWSRRLHVACYDMKYMGLFTDQKWFNLAPLFFECHILKHPGYNLGPWNMMSRTVALDSGSIMVEGFPLKFIHFSAFPTLFNQCVEFWAPKNKDLLLKMSKDYEEKLTVFDKAGYSKLPWSYNTYLSGKRISFMARMSWRAKDYRGDENPYTKSNRKILGLKRYPYLLFEKAYLAFVRRKYGITQEVLHFWDR